MYVSEMMMMPPFVSVCVIQDAQVSPFKTLIFCGIEERERDRWALETPLIGDRDPLPFGPHPFSKGAGWCAIPPYLFPPIVFILHWHLKCISNVSPCVCCNKFLFAALPKSKVLKSKEREGEEASLKESNTHSAMNMKDMERERPKES